MVKNYVEELRMHLGVRASERMWVLSVCVLSVLSVRLLSVYAYCACLVCVLSVCVRV